MRDSPVRFSFRDLVLSAGAIALLVAAACSSSATPTNTPAPTATGTQTTATATSAPTATQPAATATAAPSATAVPTAAPTAPSSGPSGSVSIAVDNIYSYMGNPKFDNFSSVQMKTTAVEPLLLAQWADPQTKSSLVLKPLLATDWSIASDLSHVDFTIRQGVKFHPYKGQEFDMTPEDVAWSYNTENSAVTPDSIDDTAGDLAATFGTATVLSDGKVRFPYTNYTSNALPHLLSTFWEGPPVFSKKLHDMLGDDGMRSVLIGTGPLKVDSWTKNGSIELSAFSDYYGGSRGMPTIGHVTVIEASQNTTRASMLKTGEVAIANTAISDWKDLMSAGMVKAPEGFLSDQVYAFGGNWWATSSILTGKPLERTLDLSKPWVSGPESADPQRFKKAELVRTALAYDIPRQQILSALFDNQGQVNYMAGFETNQPGYDSSWNWPFDPAKAKQLLTEAGYPNGGFTVPIWVGPSDTSQSLAEAVGGEWLKDLNVNVSVDKSDYSSTFRPTIIKRTVNEVWGCGADGVNFPVTWPKGFLISTVSDGGFMCGTEDPVEGQIYLKMTKLTDQTQLMDLAKQFYSRLHDTAVQVGIVATPAYPLMNPNVIKSWEMLPEGKGVLGGCNNLSRIQVN